MTEQTSDSRRDTWLTLATLAGALLLFGFFLLRPVQCRINQQPLLWRILYPALAVVAGVMVVQTIRAEDRWFETARWGLLAVAGVTGSVTFYGGPGVFLQVAKWFAIAFVVTEVLDVLLGVVSGGGAE